MSDLVKQLWAWAKRDTAMSEFGPDEHIAGIAANEIERLRIDNETLQAEIKQLRAVVDAAHRLYSGGLYPENHDYVLISDRTLDALDEALDAYDQSSG